MKQKVQTTFSTYKETSETMKTLQLLSSMGTLSSSTEIMFAEAKEIFTLVRTFLDAASETYVMAGRLLKLARER